MNKNNKKINILLAINDKILIKKIKENKNINVIKNIQYKEGILEFLEKNKKINNKIKNKKTIKIKLIKNKKYYNKNKIKNNNLNKIKINYIILNENIFGQILLNNLLMKINKLNSEVKIFVITEKIKIKENEKQNVEYFLNGKEVIEKINKNKKSEKIFAIFGLPNSGKTIITYLLAETLSKEDKVLIIEDNIINQTLSKIYKIKNKKKYFDINKHITVLNIKKITANRKKDKEKIIKEINNISTSFKFIFIDTQNFFSYKIYREIIDENIFILNSNLIEINKTKNIINLINKKNKLKVILNNYNNNSINEEILKNIFNKKIKIIKKIKNNKNYNLIINNNFNPQFISLKTKLIFKDLSQKIKKEQ